MRRRFAGILAVAAVAAFGGGFASTFETPLNPQGGELARADHVPNPLNERSCAELYGNKAASITHAVYEVNGTWATGYACNPSLYNGGNLADYEALKAAVGTRLSQCNATSGLAANQSRNLVQAILEQTGIPPEGNVCKHDPYTARYAQTCTPGTNQCQGINWDYYKGNSPGTGRTAVFDGVNNALNMCGSRRPTMAVIQLTGQLPNPRLSEWQGYPSADVQTTGQCHDFLYNNGVYFSYKTPVSLGNGPKPVMGLLEFVRERVNSTATCNNGSITQVFQELTGWNPVVNSRIDECDERRYGHGQWSSYAELKRLVQASFRCADPWVNQVYVFEYNRRARTSGGRSGECSPGLYGEGYAGNGSYAAFRDKVMTARNTLVARGLTYDDDGDRLQVTQGASYFLPGHKVWTTANGSRVFDAYGSIISDKGLGIISSDGAGFTGLNVSSPVIAAGGGNVIAAGGGNAISLGSGNVIAAGGGNVIAAGGLNLIGQAGGNVIAAGGANVIAAGGGN